jgi:uncharacterized phage infection (PIP) family protein YhgE
MFSSAQYWAARVLPPDFFVGGFVEWKKVVLRDSVSTLQMQLGTAHSSNSSLQTQLNTANSNVNNLTTELSTANSNVSSLQTQLSTANANIATLTQDLNRCKAGGSATAVAAQVTALLNVYPNPVQNGELIIDDPQLELDGKVEVYALNGGLVGVYDVAAGAQTIINISRLAIGTYIVKAGNKAAKVVKQ